MNTKGVQNAQMQGPQSTNASQDTGAAWWSIFVEGGDGGNGSSRS